jgi:geranylgeranyl diphosphate synthase, type I
VTTVSPALTPATTTGPTGPPAAAPAALRRSRDLIAPALHSAVDMLDPTSARMAAYHLGWTDASGRPARGGQGKAVRPALALLSARAAGTPARVGVAGAVAVELVHNFSLVHDDLMDGDTERRGRTTVWALWGASSAILTGDALLTLSQEVLLEDASPHRIDAARLLAATVRELIHGQVSDAAFERRDDVTLAECLDMAAGKTGALLSASAAIGAVLAGGPRALVDALARFGRELGLAFQLVDDLLGIWGDPVTTGKPTFSDLRSAKKTLPVTYAVTHGGRAGRDLAAWLAGPDTTEEPGLRRAAAFVEAAGGRQWAADEALRRVRAAEQALATADVPAGPRGELVAIARFIAAREA